MSHSSASSAKLTYDDYVLIPEDGKRHEIIDGVEYVSPAPRIKHQELIVELARLIGNYLQAHPIGRVYVAPVDVLLGPNDIVQPDLLFISKSRMAILTDKNVQGPPDLAIEILSQGSRQRDEELKLRRYERFGVAEYWIADPEAEIVRVYRRAGEGFAPPLELSRAAGSLLTTPLLPGFEIPLAELFQREYRP